MSNAVLIIGESGTGKSTSIRTLPSTETFILNVIGKPLPFRGANKLYTKLSSDGITGNYYATDKPTDILRVINLINTKRPEIKYLIIDDYGYTISNAFMRTAKIKGFEKFNDLGKDTFDVLDKIHFLRDDLFVFIMMHVEYDVHGKSKPKTIGKMIDQYVTIEGKFTYVFHSIVIDRKYIFITNNDGQHMSKTPMDMFPELHIPNDLKMIADTITNDLNADITM